MTLVSEAGGSRPIQIGQPTLTPQEQAGENAVHSPDNNHHQEDVREATSKAKKYLPTGKLHRGYEKYQEGRDIIMTGKVLIAGSTIFGILTLALSAPLSLMGIALGIRAMTIGIKQKQKGARQAKEASQFQKNVQKYSNDPIAILKKYDYQKNELTKSEKKQRKNEYKIAVIQFKAHELAHNLPEHPLSRATLTKFSNIYNKICDTENAPTNKAELKKELQKLEKLVKKAGNAERELRKQKREDTQTERHKEREALLLPLSKEEKDKIQAEHKELFEKKNLTKSDMKKLEEIKKSLEEREFL